MPKLWSETVEAHRHDVREAILDAAGNLATTEGLLAVTMSRIAADAGIGRATLYKYFPDVATILHAWHDRHVEAHLADLTKLTADAETPGEKLESVLTAYARIFLYRRQHATEELDTLLHVGKATDRAEESLRALFRDLIAEAQYMGVARRDMSPDDLAAYCLHGLRAAGAMLTDSAAAKTVALTLSALRDAATPDAHEA